MTSKCSHCAALSICSEQKNLKRDVFDYLTSHYQCIKYIHLSPVMQVQKEIRFETSPSLILIDSKASWFSSIWSEKQFLSGSWKCISRIWRHERVIVGGTNEIEIQKLEQRFLRRRIKLIGKRVSIRFIRFDISDNVKQVGFWRYISRLHVYNLFKFIRFIPLKCETFRHRKRQSLSFFDLFFSF